MAVRTPDQTAEAIQKDPLRRFAFPALSGVALVLLGLVVLKAYEDGMRTRERGQLVSSIVDQQFRELSTGFSRSSFGRDFTDLRRQLVGESFKANETPSDLAQKLQLMLHENGDARYMRPTDPTTRQSLSRWISALVRWSSGIKRNTSPAELFHEGREHYFEAAGYQKIGKPYDATVLHLWTVSLLTRFVDRDPFDPKIPEALFMLGVTYLNLRQALPPRMRGDRILNLCGELFPDSLWATRSNTVWKEVFVDEI